MKSICVSIDREKSDLPVIVVGRTSEEVNDASRAFIKKLNDPHQTPGIRLIRRGSGGVRCETFASF